MSIKFWQGLENGSFGTCFLFEDGAECPESGMGKGTRVKNRHRNFEICRKFAVIVAKFTVLRLLFHEKGHFWVESGKENTR